MRKSQNPWFQKGEVGVVEAVQRQRLDPVRADEVTEVGARGVDDRCGVGDLNDLLKAHIEHEVQRDGFRHRQCDASWSHHESSHFSLDFVVAWREASHDIPPLRISNECADEAGGDIADGDGGTRDRAAVAVFHGAADGGRGLRGDETRDEPEQEREDQ